MASGLFQSFKKVLFDLKDKVRGNSNNMNNEDFMEEDGVNGLLLSVKADKLLHEYFIPEEIIILILSYVDPYCLAVNCRLVCRSWRRLIENFAFKYKTEREYPSRLKYGIINKDISNFVLGWPLYYWILRKDIFNRNLLKNNCGQDRYDHWTIIQNGGDRFLIENPPNGAEPVPDIVDFNNHKSCFATSYQPNLKIQIIDLYSEGLGRCIMDRYQPVIIVSEWYAGRYDCGCLYDWSVQLLDRKKNIVAEARITKKIVQWEGREWQQVQHKFQDYGQGVRYVSFKHGGTDTQFWAGHFGSKFGGGKVVAFYPLHDL